MNIKLKFIQEAESRARAFALAKRGLFEFTICCDSYYTGKIERLVVLSRGKQQSWENFLIAKLFYDNLTSLEWEVLYRSKIIGRKEVYLGLKALNILPKRLVVERLNKLTQFGMLRMPERQWYIGCKTQLVSFLVREKIQTRSFQKYSGYTRHYHDHGSLRGEDIVFPLDSDEEFCFQDDLIYHFLTVGSFPFWESNSSPEDGFKEPETDNDFS